jgi:hypothetical protein
MASMRPPTRLSRVKTKALTSATQKLARVHSEIKHVVFFVVLVNVPEEKVQGETAQRNLRFLCVMLCVVLCCVLR